MGITKGADSWVHGSHPQVAVQRPIEMLIDRRHASATEGTFKRIPGAFAFERDDELFFLRIEPPKNGISLLPVHNDESFARQSEGVGGPEGPV